MLLGSAGSTGLGLGSLFLAHLALAHHLGVGARDTECVEDLLLLVLLQAPLRHQNAHLQCRITKK